jgi:hypothetical protein
MSSVFPRRAPDYAAVSLDPTPRPQLRSAVELAKERLAATQKKLVREKRLLRDVSTREKGIRERAVGRAVWKLAGRGGLEPAMVDLIRAELHVHLSPAEAAALTGTIFA